MRIRDFLRRHQKVVSQKRCKTYFGKSESNWNEFILYLLRPLKLWTHECISYDCFLSNSLKGPSVSCRKPPAHVSRLHFTTSAAAALCWRSGKRHWGEALENVHEVTSFGLSWKIQPESFTTTEKSHNPATLNNFHKACKGLGGQVGETRKVSFLTSR